MTMAHILSRLRLFSTRIAPLTLPPNPNAYSVQNVMTHEFGHWLRLLDQGAMVCSEVTMFRWIGPGETKKIDLAQSDKDGLNWQYPY